MVFIADVIADVIVDVIVEVIAEVIVDVITEVIVDHSASPPQRHRAIIAALHRSVTTTFTESSPEHHGQPHHRACVTPA